MQGMRYPPSTVDPPPASMSPSAHCVTIGDNPYPNSPSFIVTVTTAAAAAAAASETTVATEMEAMSMYSSPSHIVRDGPCFGRTKWRATMDRAWVRSIYSRESNWQTRIMSYPSGTAFRRAIGTPSLLSRTKWRSVPGLSRLFGRSGFSFPVGRWKWS